MPPWRFVVSRRSGGSVSGSCQLHSNAGSSHGTVAESSTTSTPPNWMPMFARNAG